MSWLTADGYKACRRSQDLFAALRSALVGDRPLDTVIVFCEQLSVTAPPQAPGRWNPD